MAWIKMSGGAKKSKDSYSIIYNTVLSTQFIKSVEGVADLKTLKNTSHNNVPFGTVIFEDENLVYATDIASDLGGLYGGKVTAKKNLTINGVNYSSGSDFRFKEDTDVAITILVK